MSELLDLLNISVENKPAYGDDCNNCGYCCLSEVCVVGQELTGKTIGPCSLLVQEGDKHFCSLVINSAEMKSVIGIGDGCCADYYIFY